MSVAELPTRKELSRDLREILKRSDHVMSRDEARYLVDTYYQLQDFRIAAMGQQRAQTQVGEPCDTIAFFGEHFESLEEAVKISLNDFAKHDPVGRWALNVKGIGPVLSAGLLAHIDIQRAPTVGHVWSFAGLNPTKTWEKGQKRPWNAALKVLTWKIGESFVKVSGNEASLYGRLYKQRKEYETERNENGANADAANMVIATKRLGKSTDAYAAYSNGKLPPAHIHARAKRFAVKVFLSHWHEQSYILAFGKRPANPYPIDHLGHAHYIEPEVPFTF